MSRLGKAIDPIVSAHSGLTGIYPLFDAHEAFAARALLAEAADRSLDVRCYIWRNDVSGGLLFNALREAADRGVKVRLLLDDNNTSGLDSLLAALDAHRNVEVRLFNPFAIRSPRWIGYLTDFLRLNRRMHNKSFTADDRVTIVGGRNVGDEYFGASEDLRFADLDVLAVGPVVDDVAQDFERYWTSESAHPVGRLLASVDGARLAEFVTPASVLARDPRAARYLEMILDSDLARRWNQGELLSVWAPTQMISDEPAKVLAKAKSAQRVFRTVRTIIGEAVDRVDLVSPYFVPTASGVHALKQLTKRGVRVRVLTNALEATDVAVVHAGYSKWRKDLLRGGVALYELRRMPSAPARPRRKRHRLASSGSSLHAKTVSADRSRVFIGSFNLDPRSRRLNTEMGFVIDSPELAQAIEQVLAERVPHATYEVSLADDGELRWTEFRHEVSVRHDTEPGASAWLRGWIRFLALLPVEWML